VAEINYQVNRHVIRHVAAAKRKSFFVKTKLKTQP
jgi:hypothetical protein